MLKYLIVLITISNLTYAQDSYYELLNQVEDIKYELERNERALKGRSGVNKRAQIHNALSDAKISIDSALRRRGRGRGRTDNQTLLKIKSMCNAPNTWEARSRCYKSAFSDSRDQVSRAINSCAAIQSNDNLSKCFSSGIAEAVKSGSVVSGIVSSACNETNTWDARAKCYRDFGSKVAVNSKLEVVAVGCMKISSNDNLSKCFSAGLKAYSQKDLNEIIKDSCMATNTWDSRAACYDGAVEAGIVYERFLRIVHNACKDIRSNDSKSRCYSNGL